ncbi:unnamed protein product [Spirodela intermedia]|uniref:RNA-dependent RNA polymerase n=1 Tax=Spirodela intermedia TaxID=51605 RepID=A0A7I8J3U2_SPIIN|nr:unnamed protein product [Spirodela intermedia]CAA6664760.1 unnamed protein product [Spirodela intermedia]
MRSDDLLPRVICESADRHTDVYRRILFTLKNGIAVGGKRFEFLAFSSSQLKESSTWMFASRPGLCAADIRRWMGTFSGIRNVAKHAARMGQSFGSSTETLAVGKHEFEMIPTWKMRRVICSPMGSGRYRPHSLRRSPRSAT